MRLLGEQVGSKGPRGFESLPLRNEATNIEKMERAILLKELADTLLSQKKDHPLRVGIDGVDASGKTTLANELKDELKNSDVQVICIFIDGFHNSKKIRYRKGRNSPLGYYMDTTNYKAVVDEVLSPLGPNGNGKYKTAIFDFFENKSVGILYKKADPRSILIMEGVFLFRPDLISYWDFKIFLDVDFRITRKRAEQRDGYYLGSKQNIIERYAKRYIPGQKLYFKEVHPKEKADIIIDNSDFRNPHIVTYTFSDIK